MADDTQQRALLAAALGSRNEGIKLHWRESDLTCRWEVPGGDLCVVGRRMLAYLIERAEKEEEISNEAVREQWHELVWTLLESPESPFGLQRLTWLMRVAESPHRDETNTDAWNLYLWNLRVGDLPAKVAASLVEAMAIKDAEVFVDMDTVASQHNTQRRAAFQARETLDQLDALRPYYELLKHFHALSLSGNPGTGKSYLARLLAKQWASLSSGRALGGLHVIPMGSGLNYEQLVEGPAAGSRGDASIEASAPVASVQLAGARSDGHFFFAPKAGYRDGLLLRAFAEAARQPRKDFLVLLDDIDSVDAVTIFGEMLTMLDSGTRVRFERGESGNKAWQLDAVASQVIELRYSQRLFFVPANVFLIATSRQDDAAALSRLRGRFAVATIDAPSGQSLHDELLRTRSLLEMVRVEDYLEPSVRLFTAINEVLTEELGEHATLGHVPLYAMVDAIICSSEHIEALRALAFTWRNELLPNLLARLWQLGALHLLAPGTRLSLVIEQSWLNVRVTLRGSGARASARIEAIRERS